MTFIDTTAEHPCARTNSTASGDNKWGQLGREDNVTMVGDEPEEMGENLVGVDLGDTVSGMALGEDHTCMLLDSGELHVRLCVYWVFVSSFFFLLFDPTMFDFKASSRLLRREKLLLRCLVRASWESPSSCAVPRETFLQISRPCRAPSPSVSPRRSNEPRSRPLLLVFLKK